MDYNLLTENLKPEMREDISEMFLEYLLRRRVKDHKKKISKLIYLQDAIFEEEPKSGLQGYYEASRRGIASLSVSYKAFHELIFR